MKKSLIAITAFLALTMVMGCNQQNNNNSSSAGSGSSADSGSSQDETVKVTGVTVTPGRSKVYLSEGNTVQLTATIAPENATNQNVAWSCDKPSLATVDETGLVTCLAQGTVRITATSQEDATIKDIATVEIKQYESQDDVLSALNQPLFYENYKKNTQALDDVEDINGANELLATKYFKNAEGGKDNYRVGADNPFKLNITGKITDDTGGDSTIQDPHVIISMAKYDKATSKYVDLTSETLASYATIAQDNKSVDFKDEAIGGQFKITIAADATAYASLGDGYSPINLEVEVVKGFNAYDKNDLSVFDNDQDIWSGIKAHSGLSDVVTEGLILHSDITVSNEDIPQELKYSESDIANYIRTYSSDFANWCAAKGVTADVGRGLLVDSLKDNVDVYRRNTMAGQKDFTLEGNYFKINCAGIKQVYAFSSSIENGSVKEEYSPSDPDKGCDGSHSQLFGINTRGVEQETFEYGGDVAFKNVTVIGNGDLSSDDKYLGGLITFKFNSVNFTASNVLTSKSFTTFMPQRYMHDWDSEASTSMLIDRTKCYDSYNSMIYVWGNENNIISNSIMKRAGGAIALLDEVDASKKDSKYNGTSTPKVDCYNVDLDNPVSGTEPWFVAHKATMLVQMMKIFGDPTTGRWIGRNASLHGEHKNILTLDSTGNAYINLIAVVIDGRNPLGNSLDKGSMLKGHFNVYNDAALTKLIGSMDMAKMAAADPTADDATFFTQAATEALMNNNYLPTYRLMAKQAAAQGIIAETLSGHAMLYDAPDYYPDTEIINPDTGFRNGVVASWNVPVTSPSDLNPIPFYADATGEGTEYAYNAGSFFKDDLDNLASGTYMSIYLQPDASAEYIGAFIKMQKLEMGN